MALADWETITATQAKRLKCYFSFAHAHRVLFESPLQLQRFPSPPSTDVPSKRGRGKKKEERGREERERFGYNHTDNINQSWNKPCWLV